MSNFKKLKVGIIVDDVQQHEYKTSVFLYFSFLKVELLSLKNYL